MRISLKAKIDKKDILKISKNYEKLIQNIEKIKLAPKCPDSDY